MTGDCSSVFWCFGDDGLGSRVKLSDPESQTSEIDSFAPGSCRRCLLTFPVICFTPPQRGSPSGFGCQPKRSPALPRASGSPCGSGCARAALRGPSAPMLGLRHSPLATRHAGCTAEPAQSASAAPSGSMLTRSLPLVSPCGLHRRAGAVCLSRPRRLDAQNPKTPKPPNLRTSQPSSLAPPSPDFSCRQGQVDVPEHILGTDLCGVARLEGQAGLPPHLDAIRSPKP